MARGDESNWYRDEGELVSVLQRGRAKRRIPEIAGYDDLRELSRGGQGAVVTPDVRTNSIIINAPREQLARARALIDLLDAPSFSDETIVKRLRQVVHTDTNRLYLLGVGTGADAAWLAGIRNPDLFAGVILGWESHIGRDFDKREGPPKRQMGYHALANRGFNKEDGPHVQRFTQL